ncbi:MULTISPECIES: alpha-xylosidase [Cryobacterium]|uniref:alpha-xylosidase n=1 Tax=Cryobacterium TaxID=69578 RepID=UPI000CD3FD06|nr:MULTISPECIES: alpha-xylosidase [Cryobacterium]POH64014.1 alpha-xylosidase [Cryobacterium zongtaii]TFC43225.1 alpha-xylosidase [Cryobacterium sp. TMN-39-2]TFC58675.1 alpha-xylosidase [Cryobacterium sp. TMB3-1-2]TFC67096.1 alpha-xylosidase [Cryobacterium sp. TMB3-15]TFC73391.1 alpha-xylosidase [Cryobacterium sp. TMB3-10]
MKFTDGFWHTRPGVTAFYAQEAYDIEQVGAALRVSAPTKVIERRGDVLNRAMLTVTLSSPLEGIVKVRVEQHTGTTTGPGFELVGAEPDAGDIAIDATGGTLTAGPLTARIAPGAPFNLSFEADGRTLTESGHKSIGHMQLAPGAPIAAEPAGVSGVTTTGLAPAPSYTHAQLSLGVGELVYGLGERFGPLIKNGQTIDIWNADGGTSSEQSYKNVPFYLTNRGYGVLVNHPEHVSFEVGTEAVERVQFSVAGPAIEYLVIYGPTPKQILERYTRLTGRPARVPAWSYGLWLSTSFTTQYDEATVNSFIDGMAERDLPLSVFHFDCFWMREFNWTDFEWDPRVFPDPEGMLARLHEKNLHVSAWINPYIAQRAGIFAEAAAAGYLVRKADGDVWQWDLWQAGMALVDFTNPAAVTWFQDKLRGLFAQGVDAIKTDFGERIPTDVVWHDGSSPEVMHNLYTQLYNKAVFEVLQEHRGEGDAVLFARSATVGGQMQPVHWGGDNSSSYESMAETLRGGLSLAFSGFGYWSHDIGGFEGMPDPAVFKRWLAFGLLSSHSRLHGSTSYRVPWLFDEGREEPGQSAVDVTRVFTKLKLTLMPYLYQVGLEAHRLGAPFMRPMQLEFPGDPAVDYLDRQYLLGADLLVAPVFSEAGDVQYYLPAGTWTNYLTDEVVTGPVWRRETHAFDSIPLWVRGGAVLATGSRDDRPDYDYTDQTLLTVYPGESAGIRTVEVANPLDGSFVTFTITVSRDDTVVTSDSDAPFRARLAGGDILSSTDRKATLR